jgi:small subunit ribosomal protein S20
LAAGDKSAATEAFKTAEPELMKAAQNGIIHKNTAARKVSRLAKAVKALGA